MFVDPGLGQYIVKRLNRWMRRRRRPRGVTDPYFRGVRMAYGPAFRLVQCLFAAFLLSIAFVLYFVPELFAKEHPAIVVVFVKICWIGITIVAIVAPLQAFLEFVVVSDEGLLKQTPFRPQMRLDWKQIAAMQFKQDNNSVVFVTGSNAKFKMSLCYDGWDDFRDYARRYLDSGMNYMLGSALDEEKGKTFKVVRG